MTVDLNLPNLNKNEWFSFFIAENFIPDVIALISLAEKRV